MAGIIDWSQIRQTMLLATNRMELYNPSYWDKQAISVNENTVKMAELTQKQLKTLSLSHDYTVLDVGAGTGRMTIPIAKRVKHVTALEPSENMLALLKTNATKQHVLNVFCINKSLEELDTTKAYDIVVASFSLFMCDIQKAIEKMNALSSRAVYLFMSASPWMYEELQNIAGNPCQWSDFILIYNILYDLGIIANVEIYNYELKRSFEDINDAVSKFAQTYYIPSIKEDQLREYLCKSLVEKEGKIWHIQKRKAATIWWKTNK